MPDFAPPAAQARSFLTHLECSETGERYEAGRLHNLSRVGRPLLARYDLPAVCGAVDRAAFEARPRDLWRWRELLPLPVGATPVSLGEAETPLIPMPRTAARLGAAPDALLVKDEGRLPTGSFKARGLAMAVTMVHALGVREVAMPSNGNAGAALAAYAARAGMTATVFVPADTPEINVRETGAHGTRVVRVDGLIDDCGRIVGEGAAAGRWFDLSTLKEPYRLEGKKVMSFELAAQLGWRVPDVVFYPTGGGTGLIGMWKGWHEMEAAGLIGPERPRMVAVQAEGCAPMVRAWERGDVHAERWEDARTVASGIRVPKAVGDALILSAVRESGGWAQAVGDTASLEAVDAAARDDGLLLCPEAGATLAAYGAALADGRVAPHERVVLFNCANGNKYPLPDRSERLAN